MANVHPSAIVDPRAELDPTVEVGPGCVIEGKVRIGARTVLAPHAMIQGEAEIGEDNRIGSFATIGFPPQHLEYKGAPTRTVIGNGNRIREYVSIHRAYKEGDSTTIGDNCFLMAYTHIAHDCRIGNQVIMAGSTLAGHVTVGDRAFISGVCGVHQFCRVGRLAMVGGLTRATQDVPPFMIAEGSPGYLRTLNTVGIVRAGFAPEIRAELKRVFKALFRQGRTVKDAIAELDRSTLCAESLELIDFYSETKRGVLAYAPYRKGRGGDEG